MKKLKLLFVCEDDFEFEKIEDTFLDSSLTVVGKTHDGLDGMRLINTLNPDFVVLGMVLSKVDGLEILKRLSKQKNKPKIIVLSGIRRRKVIQKAINYGAIYYMITPVNKQRLKVSLQCLCEASDEELSSIRKNFALSLYEKVSERIFNSCLVPYNKDSCYFNYRIATCYYNNHNSYNNYRRTTLLKPLFPAPDTD